ncbi:hypothetical protein HA466_0290750 [Hirschfeldia incana]|nr:hypothetical protein HA466_0290750 [Hirschfeldia incana]
MEVEEAKRIADLADQSIWGQMKEIVMLKGPAAGLWLCGPLMSLIDTAVIGQGSSLKLAALVPRIKPYTICDSSVCANTTLTRGNNDVDHSVTRYSPRGTVSG